MWGFVSLCWTRAQSSHSQMLRAELSSNAETNGGQLLSVSTLKQLISKTPAFPPRDTNLVCSGHASQENYSILLNKKGK